MKQAKIDANKFLAKIRETLPLEMFQAVWLTVADMICVAPECCNEARYSSGYCGICDIQHNDGKGERL